MTEIVFMPKAWGDLGWWFQNDIKQAKKIHKLLESCAKTPFAGIGQPEPLKANYSGYWSRRITDEHRLVYKVLDQRIHILQCRFHY